MEQPTAPPAREEAVVVIVPAFDEAPRIGRVVAELRGAGYPVLVVDDGSTDGTAEVARRAGASVVRHAVNRGQGAALQTGIDAARARGARVAVTFDGDGQHRADDVARLVSALEAGSDVVLGSRFLGAMVGASRARRWLLRLAVWVSNLLSGLRLTDAHCGLRALRLDRVAELRLTQDRMAHASELLRAVRRARLAVREVPVTVRYGGRSQSGLEAIRILFDYWTAPT